MNRITSLIFSIVTAVLAGLFTTTSAHAQQTCFTKTIDPVTIAYSGTTTATAVSTIRITRVNPACVLPTSGVLRLELSANGVGGVNEWSRNVGNVMVNAFVGSGRTINEQILTPRSYIYDGDWRWFPLTWSGDVATLPVTFEIPSGQTGAVAMTATIRVATQLDPAEWREKGPLSSLTLTVPPTLELSVSGTTSGAGSPIGMLEFGTFAASTGTSRAISIRALATTAFNVEVESTQGGVLRRTTTCAAAAATTSDAAEQLPYSVDINGQSVTPAAWGGTIGSANRYASSANTNAAPNQRVILPVTITVPGFDLATRRAGQFCDVVRLRIRAQ